jgi:dTDP-4-amino-4,6-dideoxygalactose transaminase
MKTDITIPFMDLSFIHQPLEEEFCAVLRETLRSSQFIMGTHLSDFESSYARFNQTKFAVGVSNGLDALYLSLKACNIEEGDEVIVPSNTFIASVLAITALKAVPVFAEPDLQTYNICPDNIRKSITPKTKAIMPVHLYGQACDMESVGSIAHEYNLKIIEDNAQAHGAAFKGKLTGSWGHANATSFYPGKNLGALGDAGAVTTDDPILTEKVKLMRNYGSDKKYYHQMAGHNMRMDNLQAAFLQIKLKHLLSWTNERQKIAALYSELLDSMGDIILPYTHPDATHVFHLFVIRTQFRDALQTYLTDQGIQTLIHYPIPPHLQEAYQYLNYTKGDFPIAEEIADTCLSLPLYPGLGEEQCQYIASTIASFFDQL